MKGYIPFFVSVLIFAIYVAFKLTELEWFWGCVLLASVIIYTLISNTKLTKEKLESRICDYLYDNGFEHEKEEGELYFTRKNLKYHLEIIPRDNIFLIYFSLPIQDEEYNTKFDGFDKFVLGHIINTTYRLVKVRTYNDSYCIDVSMEVENCKVFKKRFFNVMSLYDDVISDIHVQKEEIMKRNRQQQERPKIGF